MRRGGGKAFAEQLDAALSSLGREGLDVVFDSLGGDYFAPAYARLSAMGRHVQYGAASMTPHGGSPNWLTLAYQGLLSKRLTGGSILIWFGLRVRQNLYHNSSHAHTK